MKRKEKGNKIYLLIIWGIFILTLSAYIGFKSHISGKEEQKKEDFKKSFEADQEFEKENKFVEGPTDLESEVNGDRDDNGDTEGGTWVYEYWTDFRENYDLPYASQKMVDILREEYRKITFQGTFEQGNVECYDEYKGYFLKLLENEIPFIDMVTGDKCYLKDVRGLEDLVLFRDSSIPGDKELYYFFDMDEDGAPELGIKNPYHSSMQYIFRYDKEREECFLWYAMEGSWYSLLGSRKIAWPWDGGKYISFEQLDANGVTELRTFAISNWYNGEVSLYAVMLPEYSEEENKIEITDLVREQGVYERSSGCWFFRVTEEQYEELMAPFWEAYDLAEEQMEEVTYSYDELFGVVK